MFLFIEIVVLIFFVEKLFFNCGTFLWNGLNWIFKKYWGKVYKVYNII
jgi:hypothetical protein